MKERIYLKKDDQTFYCVEKKYFSKEDILIILKHVKTPEKIEVLHTSVQRHYEIPLATWFGRNYKIMGQILHFYVKPQSNNP